MSIHDGVIIVEFILHFTGLNLKRGQINRLKINKINVNYGSSG